MVRTSWFGQPSAAWRKQWRKHQARRAVVDDAPFGAMERPQALALTVPEALIDLVAERVLAQLTVAERERWVGVREAAAHLGCRPQRVYDLVSRRASSGIPHHKEGARVLFRLSELDRWIESGGAA